MEYLSAIVTVAVLHFLAVMSPGPDFIMISRNALLYSRTSAIYAALGLGLGILLHVTYSLIGIGLIISQSVILFSLLKFVSAGYLIYIGTKAVLSKSKPIVIEGEKQHKTMSNIAALRMGFITNATNPKVTIFFLSIFTLVINPTTPLLIKIIMGVEMALVTFLWFTLIAVLLSHHMIKKQFTKVQLKVERIMGVLLIALGIKLALSTSK